MKRSTMGVCLLAAALVGGFGGSALAADAPHRDDVQARPLRKMLGGQLGRLLTLRSELDLTAEQRDKIHAIVKAHRQELAEVLRPVAEKRRALRDATLADSANEATIRAAADELGKAIGDAAVIGAKVKAEVLGVLTPEQREKVAQFRQESAAAVDRFLDKAAESP